MSGPPDLEADLRAAAEEELERACSLGWGELARVTPWGDVYQGFTPAGREVCFERSYLWKQDPGFDVRVEVAVYEPREFERGVRLVREIPRR